MSCGLALAFGRLTLANEAVFLKTVFIRTNLLRDPMLRTFNAIFVNPKTRKQRDTSSTAGHVCQNLFGRQFYKYHFSNLRLALFREAAVISDSSGQAVSATKRVVCSHGSINFMKLKSSTWFHLTGLARVLTYKSRIPEARLAPHPRFPGLFFKGSHHTLRPHLVPKRHSSLFLRRLIIFIPKIQNAIIRGYSAPRSWHNSLFNCPSIFLSALI